MISRTYDSFGNFFEVSQLILVEDKLSSCVKLFLFDSELIYTISRDMKKILSARCGECTNTHLPIFDSFLNYISDQKESFHVENLKAITFILRIFTLTSLEVISSQFIPSSAFSQQYFPISKTVNQHILLKDSIEFHKKRMSWHEHSIRLVHVFSYMLESSPDVLNQDLCINIVNLSKFDLTSSIIYGDHTLSQNDANSASLPNLHNLDHMNTYSYSMLMRNTFLRIFRSRYI